MLKFHKMSTYATCNTCVVLLCRCGVVRGERARVRGDGNVAIRRNGSMRVRHKKGDMREGGIHH